MTNCNLVDPVALDNYERAFDVARQVHVKQMELVDQLVHEELELHNDMLVLDMIDTYRNLPLKLLKLTQA